MKYMVLSLYFVLTSYSTLSQWVFEKTYGGNSIDQGHDIQQTIDGGYIIVGTTSSFGNGGYDIYLLKTDELGDTLWTKRYGDFLDEECYSLQLMPDGGFVICGFQEPINYHSRILVIRTDDNGNIIWDKTIGNSGGQCATSIKNTSEQKLRGIHSGG